MIPIFIKVHTNAGLVRVNVNKIEKYYLAAKTATCNTIIDCESEVLQAHETPIQIDNLIEKAILSRFKKIDDSI